MRELRTVVARAVVGMLLRMSEADIDRPVAPLTPSRQRLIDFALTHLPPGDPVRDLATDDDTAAEDRPRW